MRGFVVRAEVRFRGVGVGWRWMLATWWHELSDGGVGWSCERRCGFVRRESG